MKNACHEISNFSKFINTCSEKCALNASNNLTILHEFTSTSFILFYPRLCFLQKAFHRLEEDFGILLDFFMAHLRKDVMKRRRRVLD